MKLRALVRVGSALAAVTTTPTGGSLARAEAPTRTPAPAACSIRGRYPGPKGASLFDAATGGHAIATLTGASLPMLISELPPDPNTGRAHLVTSLGTSELRIEGWVAVSTLATFTTRDLPISPGHVWIATAQRVHLVQATAGSVTAELALPGTGGQTVRATAPCDAFSLEPSIPTALDASGHRHGYLTKGTAIELFEAPSGSAVFTLKVAEGTAHLFWSREMRAGFVHIQSRDSLMIDAWVRQRDVEALKKGEMTDQVTPSTTSAPVATLTLDGEPKLIQIPGDVPIRLQRDDKATPMGVLEAGAEVYLTETMMGWANVLPKHLGLTPANGGGFWIPAAAVPRLP